MLAIIAIVKFVIDHRGVSRGEAKSGLTETDSTLGGEGSSDSVG